MVHMGYLPIFYLSKHFPAVLPKFIFANILSYTVSSFHICMYKFFNFISLTMVVDNRDIRSQMPSTKYDFHNKHIFMQSPCNNVLPENHKVICFHMQLICYTQDQLWTLIINMHSNKALICVNQKYFD